MTPAKTIKFTLPEGVTPEPKEKVRPFTRLDNEQDLALVLSLPDPLVKPALYLISRRLLRDPSVLRSEVATAIKRGPTQTSAALKGLAKLDLALCTAGRWTWNTNAGVRNSEQSPVITMPAICSENRTEVFGKPNAGVRNSEQGTPKNAVSDNEKHPPERRGKKEMKNNNTTNAGDAYREAVRVVDDAGLLDLWKPWVALGKLVRVSQESQIQIWKGWIEEGRADALRAKAQSIIESGSYEHPFAALKKHMEATASKQNAPSLEHVPPAARPDIRPGTRVRYPDGTEATVLAVLARGIATDHPLNPDVPLGRVRTLEVVL